MSRYNPRPVDYVIIGSPEFKATVAKLKEAGDRAMMRELRKQMRQAGDPLLKAARANVLALTSKGSSGSGDFDRYEHTLGRSRKVTDAVRMRAHARRGLRRSVAHATRIEVKTTGKSVGVRLKVHQSALPANQKHLPRHMNTGRWRHPVFGNREVWRTQTVDEPRWFDRATKTHGPPVRDAAQRAVNIILEGIA